MNIPASIRAAGAVALPFLLIPCAAALVAAPSPALSRAPAALAASEEPVPRKESAEAQLKLATELRNAVRGLEGDARNAARLRAVAACRAVRQYFPNESAPASEAAFRAGELLRAGGDLEAALAEFHVARDTGANSPFRLRALLEIGHVQRRAHALEKALASYEALLADPAATAGQRDEAALWAGSTFRDLGRGADARRVWQRVADGAEDPLDRIRAWDRIATQLVDDGDLEGAAGSIERCKEALSAPAAEETRLGERVRSALQSMRAVEDLQRAIERKRAGAVDSRGRK